MSLFCTCSLLPLFPAYFSEHRESEVTRERCFCEVLLKCCLPINNSSETLRWITEGLQRILLVTEILSQSHTFITFEAVKLKSFCALTGLEWRVFKSSCLPKKFRDEWSFGGLTYHVSGDPDGKILFKYNQSIVASIKSYCLHERTFLKRPWFSLWIKGENTVMSRILNIKFCHSNEALSKDISKGHWNGLNELRIIS